MTTISCFLAIKYKFSNTLNHVCFEKLNAKKLRIHAYVEIPDIKKRLQFRYELNKMPHIDFQNDTNLNLFPILS